jgi:hypothetical protein
MTDAMRAAVNQTIEQGRALYYDINVTGWKATLDACGSASARR